VARKLEDHPLVSEAFAKGKLSYSKVRALFRVATPENEEELLGIARSCTAAQLERLVRAAELAHRLGLRVNAGHGLDHDNVRPVAALPHVEELNIGHAIVARALFVGVERAIGEMLIAIGEGGDP